MGYTYLTKPQRVLVGTLVARSEALQGVGPHVAVQQVRVLLLKARGVFRLCGPTVFASHRAPQLHHFLVRDGLGHVGVKRRESELN
jgi:hypothetical protein